MPNFANIDRPFQTFRVGNTRTVAYRVSDCIGYTASVLMLQNVQGVIARVAVMVDWECLWDRAAVLGDNVRWSWCTVIEELSVLERDTLSFTGWIQTFQRNGLLLS
jgi:hypothetical protein